MKTVYRISIAFLILSALLQWYGIGERVYHAFWMWFKFYGYGNTGSSTISYNMFFVTFILSLILVATSHNIAKESMEVIVSKVASMCMLSFAVGLISLLVLIASPYSELVSR